MSTTVEPIVSTEQQQINPSPADVEKAATKKTAKKKPTVAKKRNSTHPSYFEMVEEAIATLKERMGSSQYAIQKFNEDKHKDLPPNFRKLLLIQLRKFVASGKLIKIKASYKLPSRSAKPVAAAVVAAPVKKAPVSAKPKAKTVPKAATGAKKVAKKAVVVEKPKAKAGVKRKAVVEAKKPVVKSAKVSVKATPSKAVKKVTKVAKKATPVKKKVVAKKVGVKPKTVKSPAKKAVAGKRGKK